MLRAIDDSQSTSYITNLSTRGTVAACGGDQDKPGECEPPPISVLRLHEEQVNSAVEELVPQLKPVTAVE